MAGRRSERSKKPVEYSKFNGEGEKCDKDSDDDFADPTPPRKKTKMPEKSRESRKEKKDEKPVQRKSRNRLSEEEKYQQELEEALKISMTSTERDATSQKMKTSDVENISQDIVESQNISIKSESQKTIESTTDTQNSRLVQADVLHSPNTKLIQRAATKVSEDSERNLNKEAIVNGAALMNEDTIVIDPVEDNEETGRRKSGRNRENIKKKQDEEEYEMSGESESEDEISSEDCSDESDYEETPKKKVKTKQQTMKKKENKIIATKAAPKKIETKPAMTSVRNESSSNKENKPMQSPQKLTPVLKKTMKPIATQSLPTTPKTSSIIRKSSILTSHKQPGKFIQSGWMPPGPAGAKSSILKSPQSPSVIRVGLSRNVRLPPLHPRVNVK
ncbi:uncharacterized protein LOC120347078 [Styela clava]